MFNILVPNLEGLDDVIFYKSLLLKDVYNMFDAHSKKYVNETAETHVFNQIVQDNKETFGSFLVRLKAHVKKCNLNAIVEILRRTARCDIASSRSTGSGFAD